MPDDSAGVAPVPAAAACERPGQHRPTHWSLLDRLENGAIGRRQQDGALSVRRADDAGCILFGPYLQLPDGRYRLSFCCRSGVPRRGAHPVLGVEIIVLSRSQLGWRDFTANELASGSASVDFAVPLEHSIESGNESRFEFRFFHLGNADLAITEIELDLLAGGEAVAAPSPPVWRLLGRLQKSWLGRRARDGSVNVRRGTPAGLLLYGGWPYLRLARGRYRLVVAASAGPPGRSDRPALGVEVFGKGRWRSRRFFKLLARRPVNQGVALASSQFTAAQLDSGPVAVDFVIPTEMALDSGADAPVDIRLRYLGVGALSVHSVDLLRAADTAPDPPEPAGGASAAPRLRWPGLRKVVMIGNCQMETLRQGFAQVELLSSRFEVKYHFVQLPRNLYDFAIRDLESCDIVLAQDIRLWEEFPLRDRIRTGADLLMLPLVRFASLWPFDSWNGPGDREAYESEAPNLTFPYLDGLLGRLRHEIPDLEARFRAYRSLELPNVVNYRRLHGLEVRRLAAMDKKFGIAIGGFILENFQKRRVFHATVRPDWQVFSQLLKFIAGMLGVKGRIALPRRADALLRNPQVPVHPKVAAALGVKWADDNTRYLNHGREITWETYIRSYIEHYG